MYSIFYQNFPQGEWVLTDCTNLKRVNDWDQKIYVVLGPHQVISGNEWNNSVWSVNNVQRKVDNIYI